MYSNVASFSSSCVHPSSIHLLAADKPSLLDIDVSCCKLAEQFLIENSLKSYAEAASLCANKVDVTIMLASVRDVYQFRKEKSKNRAAPFSCIIASSGTGKTQLAATAAAAAAAVAQHSGVFYCYTGTDSLDVLQPFYLPHRELWLALQLSLEHFRHQVKTGQFIMFANPSTSYGANDILNTGVAGSGVKFSCDLFRLLNKILFDDEDNNRAVTIPILREKVYEQLVSPLVFLDEVPPMSSRESFMNVVVLRDVLRTIGICPILMSTHTGAHNAVPSGGDSRAKEGETWCRVFLQLPQFHATEPAYRTNPWLKKTERPLVARLVIDYNADGLSLVGLVQELRKQLQQRKNGAWTAKPIFQLCQLFRTKAAEDDAASDSHALVGQHFGQLVLRQNPMTPFVDVQRGQVKTWMAGCRVRMVEPDREPLLFLALTAWKMEDIASPDLLFPLVNNSGISISVRKAFDDSPEFKKLVYTENSHARSVDGDDLEVLALASVTLASLQFNTEILQGVAFAHFVATVFHLMQPNALDVGALEHTSLAVVTLLAGSAFTAVTVPAFPCAESSFDCPSWLKNGRYNVARLKRPANAEMRDGVVISNGAAEAVLHIECKNLKNGFTKEIMGAIVSRMRPSSPISFVFTSHHGGLWEEKNAWKEFMRDLNLPEYKVCFLMVSSSKRDPYWMKIERGAVVLGPTAVTTHLVVVFATGVVAPK